jgi:hypothetical protein
MPQPLRAPLAAYAIVAYSVAESAAIMDSLTLTHAVKMSIGDRPPLPEALTIFLTIPFLYRVGFFFASNSPVDSTKQEL